MRNTTTVNSLVAVSTYFYGFYMIVYRKNENWFLLCTEVETTSVVELWSACCHGTNFLLQRMTLCSQSTKEETGLTQPFTPPCSTFYLGALSRLLLSLSSQWLQSLLDSVFRDQWCHTSRSKLATLSICRIEIDVLKIGSLCLCLHSRV